MTTDLKKRVICKVKIKFTANKYGRFLDPQTSKPVKLRGKIHGEFPSRDGVGYTVFNAECYTNTVAEGLVAFARELAKQEEFK